MTFSRSLAACLLAGALGGFSLALPARAAEASPAAAPVRDGAHDFDFDLGVWTTHITRLVHPLAGSTETIQLVGTVTVKPLWNGRAQTEEIEADGPKGHWEGLSVFLYNPAAHQWSLTFANGSVGVLGAPLIGSMRDGRIELYSQDTIDGCSIFVRGVWSDFTATSHQYQESYSDDGGKTWEVEFTALKTKR